MNNGLPHSPFHFPASSPSKRYRFSRKIGNESVETLFHGSNLWPVKQYRRELTWYYIPGNVFSGHQAGYHGAGTKDDLKNHSRQMNPQDSKFQGKKWWE
jgi:hypothetical protein